MSTFIAELIALAIIVFILARYVVPRITGPLRERQALIRKQVEDAERAQQQLAEAQRSYQNALTEARTEAAQIRENARAEAQRTVEELRQSAQEESARIVARGDDQLANQRSAVVRDLRGEIGSLAVELSDKIVNQRLTDDARISATVDAFLADLETHSGTGGGADTTGGVSR